MTLDRVLAGLGRFFVGAGILIFLFVGYQLWGTNIAEARSQGQLQNDVDQLLASPATTPPTSAAPGATTTAAPAPAPVPTGSAVAVIKIPKINLQKAVVEGTSVDDLKKAPGHYENTPLPGQKGNAAIAGHRTTYGAPFGDLDSLQAGDEIDVTTRQGNFVYKVATKRVVTPDNVSVLEPTKDDRLTLTTCHPKYSAAQRLIITAFLAPGQQASPAPAVTAPPVTTADATIPGEATTTTSANVVSSNGHSLSGDSTAKGPAVIWGVLAALVFLCVYVASRVFRRWPAYLLGTPIFLLVLFVFFENFARLLPANA